MRTLSWSFISVLFCAVFSSQVLFSQEPLVEYAGRTMGTTYSVKFRGWRPVDFKTQIEGRLFQINQQMSTYLLHSEISRLNGGDVGTWYDVSPEFIRVYDLAKDIHRQTGGAFEPTLGELVNLWGFGPKGRVTKVPNDLDLQDALRNMGFQKIISADGKRLQKTNAKVYLDFSAIAKGFAVDYLAEYLDYLGIQNYLVEVGGEVRTKGLKKSGHPWKIGIEMPSMGRSVMKVVAPNGRAVATSGDYRNYFESEGQRYSHILDPRTGRPIKHRLASVSVLAETCAEADAYATAFMVMGYEESMKVVKRLELGALFIVRTEKGFETRISETFKPYIVN